MTPRSIRVATVLSLSLFASWSQRAHAQCQSKLVAGDAATGDIFGWHVAASGQRALVGASRDDDGGNDAGSAYVFEHTQLGWLQTAKLQSTAQVPGANFGARVSLLGNRALVSAPEEADGGAVYVFEHGPNHWIQTARLSAADTHPGILFGWSIAQHGDTVLVGAKWNDAAYVFERTASGWVERQKLTGSDTVAGLDAFGNAVALGDGWAVITGYLAQPSGFQSGAAYVFRRTGSAWVETQKLVPSDAAPLQEFGNSAALEGTTIAIGAGYADSLTAAGAVYVFDLQPSDTWSETAKLVPADGAPGDVFAEVSLHGDRLAVGALRHAVGAADAGSVYLFERAAGGWAQLSLLAPFDASSGQYFGASVAAGPTLLVGAHGDDASGGDSGAVYALDVTSSVCVSDCDDDGRFDANEIAADPGLDANANLVLDACECTVTSYCVTSPNSAGAGAVMGHVGLPSLEGGMTLLATGCPPSTQGLFFYGPQQTQVPLGNGQLCVTGGLLRLPGIGASAGGVAELDIDGSVLPLVAPGSTWNFQFFYRDVPAGSAQLNLSDALSVTFCP